MRAFLYTAIVSLVLATLSGCAVRQQDLDSWVGMPVEALDTHSFFITLPMYRTTTESGVEIRNYVNGREIGNCFGTAGANINNGYVNANAFSTCSGRFAACNNIFYIRSGKVVEYAPTPSGGARCITNDSVRPQARHRALMGQ